MATADGRHDTAPYEKRLIGAVTAFDTDEGRAWGAALITCVSTPAGASDRLPLFGSASPKGRPERAVPSVPAGR